MPLSGWNRRFLDTSRGRIVQLLRTTARTVNDLAAALDLTDNAVRAHLATLERDGLVQQSGRRKGIRRPHLEYTLTPAGEDLFPKAYSALLAELLNVIGDRLPPDEIEGVLREVGRRLAAGRDGPPAHADLLDRAGTAVAVLNELGGQAAVKDEDGRLFICGESCPLAALVAGHPEACRLAEALVAEIVGHPVRESCEKGAAPRCRFEIGTADESAPPASQCRINSLAE